MLQFIQEHAAAFSALGLAVLDFAIHMAPGLKSSGLLHMAYLMLGGKESE